MVIKSTGSVAAGVLAVYSIFCCNLFIVSCELLTDHRSSSDPIGDKKTFPAASTDEIATLVETVNMSVHQQLTTNWHYNEQNRKQFSKKHANIILFPPIIFDSHVFIFTTLAKGLKDYGHKLTLFISDRRTMDESDDYSIKRYPGIFSTEEAGAFLQQKVSNILSGKPTFIELFDILGHYSKNCDVIFTEGRASLDALRREKYDLMIVDPNEMCGFLVARELGIPYVVFSTGMWVPYEAYIPSPISYVPEFNSQLTDRMNFMGRLYNTLLYGVSRFGTSYLIFPLYNRLIVKHRIGFEEGEPRVYLAEIASRTQAWLLCTDLALEFPRPTLPHVEFVGGILGRPVKPLRKELQDWADDSTSQGGFVIVSFGAGVKRLNVKLETIFSNVLSSYPTILSHNLGPNVKLVDWLPQSDLLAHPNARLFVSHGGTNGVYESLYHAVPIVGMPLFGDHYDSLARIQSKGAGISLNWKSITESQLYSAITDVATNPKYREAMQRLSAIHHDQPMTALQRAVYRIDYTFRYEGAKHLRPSVYDLNLIQFFLIDVQFVIISACFLVTWTLHWLILGLVRGGGKVEGAGEATTPRNWSWSNAGLAARMIYDIPKFLGTSVVCVGLLLLLTACSGLRRLATLVTYHCGKCSGSSRAFLRCLNIISRQADRFFPSRNTDVFVDSNEDDIELAAAYVACTKKSDVHSLLWDSGSGRRNIRRNFVGSSTGTVGESNSATLIARTAISPSLPGMSEPAVVTSPQSTYIFLSPSTDTLFPSTYVPTTLVDTSHALPGRPDDGPH